MTKDQLLQVLEAAKDELASYGACDKPSCSCPGCDHALPMVREAIEKLKRDGVS